MSRPIAAIISAVRSSCSPGSALITHVAIMAVVVLLLAAVAAALFFALRPSHQAPPSAPQSAGPAATWAAGERPAPAFNLLDERGDPFSLASLRGRPVIVTFIDPLCRDYCPIEAQRLNDVASAFPHGSKVVQTVREGSVILVDADDERSCPSGW